MSEEEWDMTDDSSSETESPPAGSDKKCLYCEIPKVMAESRLFEVPEALKDQTPGFYGSLYYDLELGSNEGCQFCDLLADAISVWKQEKGVDYLMSTVEWSLEHRCGQFLIRLHSYYTPSTSLLIFRGTGLQSQWNLGEHPLRISGDTSSPVAVATARRWLEDCKNNHKHCKRETHAQTAPKRILELDSKQVKLCENVGPAVAYACLSHCWGPNGPAMQLRPNTIADLTAGVPLETLPKTFHDAAWFCWRLGIHYIWIDALCIIQGDEADWEEAAAAMADVYEGAAITLAATWSSSSEDGCFASPIHNIALSERGLYCGDYPDKFPRTAKIVSNNRWPLFHRAWVYQERKLSIRVLHFGKQQLFWECNSRLFSEDDLKGREPDSLNLKSSEIETNPEAEWRNVVEHYSPLMLTYEKYRLPAISACVERMQRLRKNDVYIAGMWKKTLRRDLHWYPLRSILSARPNRPGLMIPSWSWISTSSGVSHDHTIPLLSLDDIDITYNITGPAHIGQVSHAELHLKARFIFVKPDLMNKGCSFKLPHGIWENDGILMTFSDGWWDFDYTTADPPIHANETFVALLLSRSDGSHFAVRYFGLVLRELANKRFERVGHVHIRLHSRSESEPEPEVNPEWLFFLGLPIGEFTIV